MKIRARNVCLLFFLSIVVLTTACYIFSWKFKSSPFLTETNNPKVPNTIHFALLYDENDASKRNNTIGMHVLKIDFCENYVKLNLVAISRKNFTCLKLNETAHILIICLIVYFHFRFHFCHMYSCSLL